MPKRKENKKELLIRVRQSKSRLSRLGKEGRKSLFFESLGKMKYSDFMRYDNLWNLKIVDEDFTKKLESYKCP